MMIIIFVPDDVMALGLEFGSWGILPSRCVEGVGQKKVRSRPAAMGLNSITVLFYAELLRFLGIYHRQLRNTLNF
jgi:hypothetical protein